MFVYKPVLLLLAVSLPIGSTVSADNVVPVARAFSSDDLANITSRGVTTNPAVTFKLYSTTTCGDETAEDSPEDATCFPLEAGSLAITWLADNCNFVRVFSSYGCTGSDYADLGNIGECWQVALRHSYQVYC